MLSHSLRGNIPGVHGRENSPPSLFFSFALRERHIVSTDGAVTVLPVKVLAFPVVPVMH